MNGRAQLLTEAHIVSESAKVTTATVWSNGKTVRRYCGQDREGSGNYVRDGAERGFRKMTMILIDNGGDSE